MKLLQHIRNWLVPQSFELSDVVHAIEAHSEVKAPLIAVLNLEPKQRVAALKTLIQRVGEMNGPSRLQTCLFMLKDDQLAADVLNELQKN